MKTRIATGETSTQSSAASKKRTQSKQRTDVGLDSIETDALQKELTYLKELLKGKDAQIDQLSKENKYLYEELDRLRNEIKEDRDRSDALIDKMQAAAEEASEETHSIIMHLSHHLEAQAQQIAILRESRSLKGTVRKLTSKISSLRVGSMKLASQLRLGSGK